MERKEQDIQINYVNQEKILELVKRNKKLNATLKLYRTNLKKVIAVSMAVSALVFGTVGYNLGTHKEKSSINYMATLPEDYIMTNLDVTVKTNDNISLIASNYYNDNYTGIYNSFDNYVQTILKNNGLEETKIYPGDVISIPVVFNKNNTNYLEINNLQHQINEIINNEYWVSHTVTYSDSSISALAAQASGSENETIEFTRQIIQKNNLTNSTIKPGQVLQIINPELGSLKMALKTAKEGFNDSVKNAYSNQENIQK